MVIKRRHTLLLCQEKEVKEIPKITIQSRIDKLRKEYEKDYDLSTINNSNDAANLETLFRSMIMIQDLQEKQIELMEGDLLENAGEFKKLNDMIKQTQDSIMAIERQLGIDRKSRKTENNVESPAMYIAQLKSDAKDWLELRIKKVYCTGCQIQIFRFLPTYEHNKFELKITCPQCNKVTKVHRSENTILYDVPARDRKWREQYPMTIEHPKVSDDSIDQEEDELHLG